MLFIPSDVFVFIIIFSATVERGFDRSVLQLCDERASAFGTSFADFLRSWIPVVLDT